MVIEEINKLKELDVSKQLAFAYLTCERLFPNYVYFSQNYGFGNPAILRKAMDFVYYAIFQKNEISKSKLLIKEVHKNTPDTENYATNFVSSALDACTAIEESLNFLIDRQFERIESISTFATDTVDMYIQEIDNLDYNSDSAFQQKIDDHFLMKKEIRIQKGIIDFLVKINSTTLDSADIQTLLNLQKKNKSNLDL